MQDFDIKKVFFSMEITMYHSINSSWLLGEKILVIFQWFNYNIKKVGQIFEKRRLPKTAQPRTVQDLIIGRFLTPSIRNLLI